MRTATFILALAGMIMLVPSENSAEEYKVGFRDVVEVDVLNHPEFHTTASVNAEGYIRLNILGEIHIGGMPLRKIDRLVSLLLARDYLKDPQVIVSIKKYKSMRIFIFGYVKNPGVKDLDGPTNLLELIALAGDFTEGAGSEITIERSETDTVEKLENGTRISEPDTLIIDMNKLLKEGDLSLNIELRNNDKIYVPGLMSRGQIYVFGHVSKPGYYPYSQGMNLFEAINKAGGFTEFANQKSIKIKRRVAEGSEEREEIKVNLKKLLKQGELESNVPIQPDDIIVVPASFFF
jgi:polysaccharide export outer membrane protein